MDSVKFYCPSHPGVNQWASDINNEAEIAGVPPCALAAIVARETGGRNVLQDGMQAGDPECGVGLCQITAGVDWSNLSDPTYQGFHLLKPADNLYVAAAYFLKGCISNALRLQRTDPIKFARFGGGQVLYYAFAAYNEGAGAVNARFARGEDPDGGTTDSYARDVLFTYLSYVAESHHAVGAQ